MCNNGTCAINIINFLGYGFTADLKPVSMGALFTFQLGWWRWHLAPRAGPRGQLPRAPGHQRVEAHQQALLAQIAPPATAAAQQVVEGGWVLEH